MCSCFASSQELYNENLIEEHQELLSLLCITRPSSRQLLRYFNRIDEDHSGQISFKELLEGLESETNPFSKRVFEIFDEDGSGEIDFREFITALWNYCTLTRATLVIFAFDLYDKDGSGTLEPEEIGQMCRDVYGSSFKNNKLALNVIKKTQILTSVLDRQGGEINVRRFATFCDSHPALLYPAFQFQRKLQNKFMGVAYWESMSNKRLHLGNGKFISIDVLLHAHLHGGLFSNLERHESSVRQDHQNLTTGERVRLDSRKPTDVQGNWDKLRTKVVPSDVSFNRRKSFSQLIENSGTVTDRRNNLRLKKIANHVSTAKYIQTQKPLNIS